jgi:hypothetical protein
MVIQEIAFAPSDGDPAQPILEAAQLPSSPSHPPVPVPFKPTNDWRMGGGESDGKGRKTHDLFKSDSFGLVWEADRCVGCSCL